MRRKSVLVLLAFVSTLLIIGLIWIFYSKDKLFKTFGERYTSIRKTHGLPGIEDGMKAVRYSDEKVVFSFGIPDSSRAPYHLRKILKVKNEDILLENDEYYKYLGDNKALFLDYEFTYGDNKWKCYISEFNFNNSFLNTENDLSLKEADSILLGWGLRRNP